jgi:hypothetical protein
MLDSVTAETFQPHVGEEFNVSADDKRFTFRLGSVELLANVNSRPRVPFTLVFYGPADNVLPQMIYRLEHESLGPMEVFLVPIGPDAVGMRYEAVFT